MQHPPIRSVISAAVRCSRRRWKCCARRAPRGKPDFDLYETIVDGATVPVTEAIEAQTLASSSISKHKGKGAEIADRRRCRAII